MLQNASTRSVEKVRGTHLFKIMAYSVDNDIGKGEFLESTVFTVGGYDWSICYYPNGCKEADNSISIALCLKGRSNEVKAQFVCTILDQTGMPSPMRRSSKMYCFKTYNDKWGFRNFVKRTKLESHLKDDCFIMKCTVDVLKVHKVEPGLPIVVPPANIQQQLGHLLELGNGADVKFEVEGQTFSAHKCILAARSPVFCAKFVRPSKEKSGTIIKIEDMEAPVFKALLHFVYTDTCPEIDEIVENNEKQENMSMAQPLLVAADRYALEKLKVICVKQLYGNIDVSNVFSLLFLADRHNCSQLKISCLKFLASPEVFGQVLATDEFQNLVRDYPSILKELSQKRG